MWGWSDTDLLRHGSGRIGFAVDGSVYLNVWPRIPRAADRRFVASILLCALTAFSGAFAEAPPPLIGILFTPQRSYREAASALEAALKEDGYKCVSVELPAGKDPSASAQALKRLADAGPTVIAAAGVKATSLALETVPKVPVIFFMVPNALDASFATEDNPDRKRLAGVPADIAPRDQIRWIVGLHAMGKMAGVLHSSRTKKTAEAFVKEAENHQITMVPIQADKNQFPEAIEALNAKKCDGVLMIPDAGVYNVPNVQRLLLWGIRQKKPVWAFSASVVKAGALGGQYANCESVGQRAAELVKKVSGGADPADIGFQYPRKIGRAVNERTAELIGVGLSKVALTADTVRYGETR